MKIESGRYYKTRDGRKVGPMVEHGQTSYGYNAVNDGEYVWRKTDGANYPNEYNVSASEELDLIAEWADEPTTTHNYASLAAQHGIKITVQVGEMIVEYDGRAR